MLDPQRRTTWCPGPTGLIGVLDVFVDQATRGKLMKNTPYQRLVWNALEDRTFLYGFKVTTSHTDIDTPIFPKRLSRISLKSL